MKIKSFFIAVLIFVLIFLIVFFGIDIVMKIIVGHRNEVKVPNIVDMNYDVARKQCKEHDLFVTQVDMQHSDEIEKGRIISQKPHADQMTKKSRTIDVIVSKGPQMLRVPYLDNTTVEQAAVRLENAGLKLGKKEFRYSDEVPEKKIIYSLPRADEFIPKGSTIDIIISLGPVPSSSDDEDEWRKLLE